VDAEVEGDMDLAAAKALARRRRLGPWRATGRAEHRDRDLAVLGRAGFPYAIARRVVDAPSPDEIEED
jgi:regulatory protein